MFASKPPINRILLVSFIAVALIPVLIVSIWVYRAAWDNAWHEIMEKHQLLAQNLAVPISTYVQDHRRMLGLLAADMSHDGAVTKKAAALQGELARAAAYLDGFRSLSLLDTHGRILASYHRGKRIMPASFAFTNERCYIGARSTGKWQLSGVKRSPIDGRPTLIMAQPVRGANGRIQGVVMGELRIDLIDAMRKRIHFGQRGHSAIVDQYGHVIAHPNPAWMAEMKDISSWPIVKDMMAGKTGVTEFYSPFMGQQMVAGYASVPGIGWGIMVPQPKSEVARQVDALLFSHWVWSMGGLLLAVLVATWLSRWITRPINRLMVAGERLEDNDCRGQLAPLSGQVPREIARLDEIVRRLVTRLQTERDKVGGLNDSLRSRVEEATQQLREANARLEVVARQDYLTGLINRRHFEHVLGEWSTHQRVVGETVCILLIDIDNFKQINDRYGHAAGDAVLTQVARILESAMRKEDLVARYGGDEFVALLYCSSEVAKERARALHEAIQGTSINWREENVALTTSIGLFCHPAERKIEIEQLLHQADVAMYRAKEQGRNKVVELRDRG